MESKLNDTSRCTNCSRIGLKFNIVYCGGVDGRTSFAEAPDCERCSKIFCIHCMSSVQGVCKFCYIEGESDDD